MSDRTSADTTSSGVSLADEEGTKQILVDSVLGLWDVVNNLTRLKASRRGSLSRDHLRLGASAAGNVRL